MNFNLSYCGNRKGRLKIPFRGFRRPFALSAYGITAAAAG
ncbi:hypothetical protein NEIELOOT_01887 [Neisseria elongata subsp. glycolytica ATCC 29315]|uniref:Uncharacterized protein n=1 Tax=Neisseria elongata subsp. glycolytica ATCC 29315 TaxID=546263 RepID=D4DS44_NEIEG|nr:hypothetical protein NEIELOOT_01887 [Neisseria elongata subsp. glycolytica ATCC 29315]